MAPRPNWKGFLKLSLVSCSVSLYPATSASERVSSIWMISKRRPGKSIQARRNYRLLPPFVCQSLELTAVEAPMNGIIYIIGLIVVIMAILSFLGLR